MKKRILVSTIAAILIFSLCGCGDNSSTDSQASTIPNWDVAAETTYTFPTNVIGYYDKNYGLSVGLAGEIHYSDGTENEWPKAENNSLCRFGLDFVNENIAYTCGNGGNITKTSDGGKTWTELETPSDISAIYMSSPTNFYFIGTDLNIYSTTDGGSTWTNNALNLPAEQNT